MYLSLKYFSYYDVIQKNNGSLNEFYYKEAIVMNEVLNTIKHRRSIRKYTGELITDADLKTIIEAGFYAPTARNIRPTHFIIVKDKEKLEGIAEAMPNARYCTDAGCAVIVCGDRDKDVDGYLTEDASAAIMNMLLAADSMGLGALWCGVYPREERVSYLKKEFCIPDNILPVGLVLVGVADEEKEIPERYEEEKVHCEIW